MKKLFLFLLALALMLCLCACGEPQSPEDRAQQFLSTLLADDAELQQLLLDSVTVIGEGVPQPTEEELAERTEREAALTQMLHDRFDGLASPALLAKSANDGCLTLWQSRLAYSGAKAAIRDCSFTEEDSRLVFEASVHCVNGEEETDLPLRGEVVFDEDGLVDSFYLDEDKHGCTGWLIEQETVVLNEKMESLTQQP